MSLMVGSILFVKICTRPSCCQGPVPDGGIAHHRAGREAGRRRPRAARPPRATHRRGKVTKVGGIATRRHPRHTPAAATTRPVYLWCSWQKCISDQPQDQDHTAAVNQLCSRGKSTHRNMRRSANGKWLWLYEHNNTLLAHRRRYR